jgi:outer membrane protein
MLLLLALLASRPAPALSLLEAFELAQQQDPTLAGSRSSFQASQARVSQSIAQLKPQLSISATNEWNHRNYTTLNPPNTPFPTPPQTTDFASRTAQLNLDQPLWRRANHIAVAESRRMSEQSQSELRAAAQDMMVRLLQGWFDFMLAADDVSASEQKIAASRLFWEQARRAAQIALIGPDKLEEAHSKFELAVAERMEGLTEEDTARGALEQIIGSFDPFEPPSLPDDFEFPAPGPGELDAWLSRIDAGPLVEAARQARLAADEEIRKQEAGHGLTVDLIGSITRNHQPQGNFPDQEGYDIKQNSIGVQVALPLYSGGGTSAKVREAVALRNKADQDLLSTSRKARSTALVSWSGWRSGCVRMKAAQQSVHAASVALQVASSGSTQGLKFDLDVMEARQSLLEAWRDLQKARYATIMSWVKLKAVAGDLGEDDLRELQRHMMARSTAPAGADKGNDESSAR